MTRLIKYISACAAGGILGFALFSAICLIRGDGSKVLSREAAADGTGVVRLQSAAYTLDRVFESMQGPRSNQAGILLAERPDAESIVWLRGVRSEIIDASTGKVASPVYFCHANLTLNPDNTSPERHNASFESRRHLDWRLFTLIPGRLEIQLPNGFGIPIREDTALDYYTMTLNKNPDEAPGAVRVRTEIRYEKAAAGDGAMRPLFRRSLIVYQQHDEVAQQTDQTLRAPEARDHGEQCAAVCLDDQKGGTASLFASLLDADDDSMEHPGATCCVENASDGGIVPQFGEENTAHWMAPPGRHVYRTEVTEQLKLPFDTTAHYVTGHLHPYGKKLTLVEMDSGDAVFEITSRDHDRQFGVAWMSEIESEKGIRIYADRRYELLAEYHNTSNKPVDVMGILYVYALDEPVPADDLQVAGQLRQ